MPQVVGWALIEPNGTVAGATAGTTVKHPSPGNYNIFFDFDAGICIQIATLANKNNTGWIAAFGEPELFGPNEVTVQTGNFPVREVLLDNGQAFSTTAPVFADMLFQLIIVSKT
jgi:hypothetical protein